MTVKSRPENLTSKTGLKEYYGVDENFNEIPLEQAQKQLQKETGLSNQKTFINMTVEQLGKELDKFIEAVKIIKKKMVNGVHYLEIQGVEKPIITKQGTSWLAAATNMSVFIKEIKEVIKPEINFIMYQHQATAKWGENRSTSAFGSANSKEYNQRQKYEAKDKQKTVYDTINDVCQMSQKRAKSQAVRELIAMTDVFDTNEDNPKAKRTEQMKIYTLFFKHFLKFAPTPPKKTKLKNGKWKFFNEKEKLNWQKDYLKAKYFTPNLYELGMGTYGQWGIKDVELLTKKIPQWEETEIEKLKEARKI